jgi:acetyltransferase-like isoleucine patch superfamily enzyme
MEIFEVTHKEFEQVIFNPLHNYGKADFNDLNKNKCELVYYLLFKETKFRLGIIGGIRKGVFHSSYSAPFGSFLYVNKNIGIDHIDSAVDALIEWAKTKKLKSIHLILPPPLYDETFISKQTNSFFRKNFTLSDVDVNFSFKTELFKENYFEIIQKNARNNLNKALKSNLKFYKCDSTEEKEKAYNVIVKHKRTKGYPLKMTWNQITDTGRFIEQDFFLVYNLENVPVASAIVFHSAKSVVQIIYWGEDLEYAHLRTMNFLAYKIFEYYSVLNYKYIDLGPSSENSVPNIGLCDFKESIGCDVTLKKKFHYKLVYSMIHPMSDVQTTNIGENTTVWQYCIILPNAVIGSNCNINCHVFIENEVVIGNNVTVKTGVQLWDGITLEDDVFVGPNVTFTNDAYPRSKKNQFNFLQTVVKKGASIGANATILSGITIGRYSMVGAGAIVTKNISDFELWVGNPARQVGFISESGEVLDMNLKSKTTGKQYQWIENRLAIKSDYIIRAEGISMRLIEESDAKFIISLRTDAKLGLYISETSSSIENQIGWIKEYKKRESNQKEFYFIFEDSNNRKWGTIRLYNLVEDSFTVGSWICLNGNKNHIAIKSFLCAIKFGFENLYYKTSLLDVRKKNLRVLYYLKLFNPVLVKEDDLNYFFRLEKNTFYNNISKIINALHIKL